MCSGSEHESWAFAGWLAILCFLFSWEYIAKTARKQIAVSSIGHKRLPAGKGCSLHRFTTLDGAVALIVWSRIQQCGTNMYTETSESKKKYQDLVTEKTI